MAIRAAASVIRLPGRGDGGRAVGRRGGAHARRDRLSGRRLGPLAPHDRRGRDLSRRGRARTEILVVLLPLTRETRHIVDRSMLYQLPRGAKLINCGRGGTVDETALLAALHDGQIAEATLDVFETEPLPPDHPFWAMEQVLVLPHTASIAVPEIAARDVVEK